MAVAHYIDALAWQRQIVQLQTIFGGKNPHPNVLVGGAPAAISVHSGAGTGSTAVNAVGLQKVASIIDQMRQFVDQVYVPDTLAIASFYKDWFKTGYGEGNGNFMTYGDFPATGSQDPKTFWCRAAQFSAAISRTLHEIDLNAEDDIKEFVSHSWYDYSGGKDVGLHPLQRGDPFELHRAAAALSKPGYLRQLLLAQVAALEGTCHGSRPAGPRTHAVCTRPRATQGAGR